MKVAYNSPTDPSHVIDLEKRILQLESEKNILASICKEYLGELYSFGRMIGCGYYPEMPAVEREARLRRTQATIQRVQRLLFESHIETNISI